MFVGQRKRRFWEQFTGIGWRAAGRRRSRPPHRSRPRTLRVEALEERELLSVSGGPDAWKPFAFTSSGLVTGKLTTPQDYNGGTYDVPLVVYHDRNQADPSAFFDGTIVYETSPNQGTIGPEGSSLTGHDAWRFNVPAYYNPPPPGTWTLEGGSVISITDSGGKLTGTVDLTTVDDTKYFETSNGVDLGGIYTLNGSFSTSTLALNATFSIDKYDNQGNRVLWGSFTYKGTMTPTNEDPFDINVVQESAEVQQSESAPQLTWGPNNSVEFDVDISGPVQKAKSETTPITYIQVFWAKGTNLVDRISKTPLKLDTVSSYKSGIPLYWNQASGHYTIENFLPSKIPANATNLLFVAKVPDAQGKWQEKLLGTLDLPSVSIEKKTVDEPAAGTTADAEYTVTYSVPEGFTPSSTAPVTVAWKTGNGTAKAKKDYLTSGSTLTFNAPGTQTIRVPIVGDSIYEPDETFNITATVKNASFAAPVAETIHDPAAPKLLIKDVSGFEGTSGTVKYVFAVELDTPSSQWIKVDYTLQEGADFDIEGNPVELISSQIATAGLDYVSPSGQPKTLTFGPGKTSLTITVVVRGDKVAEDTEYFAVNLANARTQGSMPLTITKAQGVGQILDGAPLKRVRVWHSEGSRTAAEEAALAAYFGQLGQDNDDASDDLAAALA